VFQQIDAGGQAVGIESRIPELREHTLQHFTALVIRGP
jgi:hypothetical protein